MPEQPHTAQLRARRRLPTTAVMSSTRFSEAPLLSGGSARWIWLLAMVMFAAGCGSLPFTASPPKPPVSDIAARPRAEPAHLPETGAAASPAGPITPTPGLPRPMPGSIDPPDAVPRVERISADLPNLQYRVRGQEYRPTSTDVAMRETGLASWYGEPFHGRRTANGEVYDMNAMTAAHKTMPLPSYAVVRNRRNGKQVVVRINDRGPFKDGRVIDLSRAAARKLGISGLANVDVRRITNDEIRMGSWKLPAQTFAGLD
jgi:rare lipoprotein A